MLNKFKREKKKSFKNKKTIYWKNTQNQLTLLFWPLKDQMFRNAQWQLQFRCTTATAKHQIHQLMLNHAICWVWGRWGVKYYLRERLHDQKNGLTQDAVFYEIWNTFFVLESFCPPFFFQRIAPFSYSTPTSKAGFSYFSLISPHTH